MPALDLGADLGHADAFEQQFFLLAEIDHRVVREGLDLLRQALAGVLQLLSRISVVYSVPSATTVPLGVDQVWPST